MREAASETLAAFAKNYVDLKGSAVPRTHTIFRIALDALISNNKDSQAAGGATLAQMASFVGPLDKETTKHLLRLLVTNHFTAKQHVLHAFASWNAARQRGSGFLVRGLEGMLPSIGALVGTAAEDGGHGAHTYQSACWAAWTACPVCTLLATTATHTVAEGQRLCRHGLPGLHRKQGLGGAQGGGRDAARAVPHAGPGD